MPDVFNKKERSEIMSRIRSKNTKLESDFLKELSAELYPRGYRYRKHYSNLAGKPDVVFVRQKVAVFIDSDFWHGRDFSTLKKRLPKKYWVSKISKNKERDRKVSAILKKSCWIVLRFWGRDLKKNPRTAIEKINKTLKSRNPRLKHY